MRLWTLHPKHLDPPGLVALWREALLAQAVIAGATRGYRNHPQLARFLSAPDPSAAISAYLCGVLAEAVRRRYNFNGDLILCSPSTETMLATEGQIAYEWRHLGAKLQRRNLEWYASRYLGAVPEAHPMFQVVAGPVAEWERVAFDNDSG